MKFSTGRKIVLLERAISELIKQDEGCRAMFIQMLMAYVGRDKAVEIVNRLEEGGK